MANAQKIAYFDVENKENENNNEIRTEEEKIVEPVKKEEVKEREIDKPVTSIEEKPMDLKDIDKKLDEILADDNLMTKV